MQDEQLLDPELLDALGFLLPHSARTAGAFHNPAVRTAAAVDENRIDRSVIMWSLLALFELFGRVGFAHHLLNRLVGRAHPTFLWMVED